MIVNMDYIQNGKAHGDVAKALASGPLALGVGAMRPYMEINEAQELLGYYANIQNQAIPVNNATLRKDEWKAIDAALLKVSQERLVGVADLNARGLTFNLTNGMGSTVLEYENIGDISAAELSMDGLTRSQGDRPNYEVAQLPLPIVHKDFQVNQRVLEASRMKGDPLDTTMAELAGRVVLEQVETMLFQGTSLYKFGGGTIYGYVDQPNRNTETLSVDWDASAADGDTVIDDVKAMKQAAIDAKHYGPYVLYIPTAYETVLDCDYKANSDKTIRERILQISKIEDVKVADKLAANNVLLVQMTSDVVRMVNGLPLTTVQWEAEGGFTNLFKVLTIQVPQVRADQDGNSGIVHLS